MLKKSFTISWQTSKLISGEMDDSIPTEVGQYLLYFSRMIEEKNVAEVIYTLWNLL